MTTPTPEQVAQWREDAENAYVDDDSIHGFDDGVKCYAGGYLRAKTDMLDMMKLARPITAKMVTAEMIDAYVTASSPHMTYPKTIAAAYNAVNAYLGAQT